jgi:hypothetical protein
VTLCSFIRSRNTQARGRRKRTLDHATHKRAGAGSGNKILGISSWHPTSLSCSSSCSNFVTLCSFVRSRNTQARRRRKCILEVDTRKYMKTRNTRNKKNRFPL